MGCKDWYDWKGSRAGTVKGSSKELAKACTNDYPKCKAYEWTGNGWNGEGWGWLCSSTRNGTTSMAKRFCVQSQGYISYYILVRFQRRTHLL